MRQAIEDVMKRLEMPYADKLKPSHVRDILILLAAFTIGAAVFHAVGIHQEFVFLRWLGRHAP